MLIAKLVSFSQKVLKATKVHPLVSANTVSFRSTDSQTPKTYCLSSWGIVRGVSERYPAPVGD